MLAEVKHFVDILPEPSFLLTAAGDICFANAAAAELTGLDRNSLVGVSLKTLAHDRPEKVDEYLKYCARSRQLIPGAINIAVVGGRALEVRCDGTVLEPKSDTSEGLLFVRCRPRAEATDQFVLLNQKILALSKEIVERKKAEQQRDELLENERRTRGGRTQRPNEG